MNKIRKDFPFASKYMQAKESNMHYIDEGTGDPILFIHGNPTSSYLWRNIIPHLPDRKIALDLIGFGKSDKPDIDYTFADHVQYVDAFIQQLDLSNITLVLHDWGGPLGLYYAMRHEERIKGIVLIEPQNLYPFEDWAQFSPPEAISIFRALRDPEGPEIIKSQSPFIEGMRESIIGRPFSEEEQNYYREPFADPESRKPMWTFPTQIAVEGEPEEVVNVVKAYNQWLQETRIPILLPYANPGAHIRESQRKWCREHIRNLKEVYVGQGFHFLPEDNPHQLGEEILKWYQTL